MKRLPRWARVTLLVVQILVGLLTAETYFTIQVIAAGLSA